MKEEKAEPSVTPVKSSYVSNPLIWEKKLNQPNANEILIVIYRFHLIYETPLLHQALPQVVEVQREDQCDPSMLPIFPQKSIFLPWVLPRAPTIPIMDNFKGVSSKLLSTYLYFCISNSLKKYFKTLIFF